MSNATLRLVTPLLGGALLLGACTVKKQETPSLTGPSELSTAITVSVSPDVLAQDGASQSVVTITARDANGQPLRNASLRAEIAVGGIIADFGTLSARNVVTDANGRATLTYTAPPAPAFSVDTGTLVQIQVTPAGTDFGNAAARFATIRLTPPGVVTPPANGLTPKFVATPPSPTDHQTVIFDASSSTTTNATIVSYRWNFGDGDTGSGITAQHAFDDPGTFIVTLTVTDSIGRTNSLSQSINVAAGALPTAAIISSPSAPVVGQTVNFNGSTSRPAPGRTIRSYDWNFGDGGTASGAQVTHAFTAAGTYTVVLTVTDDAGRVATATTTITVGTGNPTADFTFSPSSPTTATPVNFDGASSVAATGHTIVSYSWSFGDGASGSGSTVSHHYTSPGTYVVRLTVTDDQGKTNFITKSVTVS
jgi:PKD repeat protein